MKLRRLALAGVAVAITLMATACSAPSSPSGSATPAQSAVADSDAMTATLGYISAGLPDMSGKKIAYIAECATENTYCQTRLTGAQDAAAKIGADLTLFNAGFDPAAQLPQVQDAIQRGFDGYVFSPVADSSGCAEFQLLKATGKPVVNINSPMCGNPDFTDGTDGFVAMQTESFFQQHVENAFASCTSACKAVAVGGYVGSDLYTRWETAITAAKAKYPNVTVVSDQPGSFDAATALTVVQDALSSNPDVSVVVSSWDDMTRGAEQAIVAAGKKPGTDVRIYSVGGTKNGVAEVAAGTWNSTTVLLPYEESYYGVVQLANALKTGDATTGFTYLAESPVVTDGPGSIFITADNASKFTPEY